MDVIKVEPDDFSAAAPAMVSASRLLSSALATFRSNAQLGSTAFGYKAGAIPQHYGQAQSGAGTGVQAIVTSLETLARAFSALAAFYQRTDNELAGSFGAEEH